MSKFVMMVGISGSGKSTTAERLNGFKVVSSDAIREELYGDASDQRHPEIVFQIAHRRICEFLEVGMNVVFDATNLRRKDREALMEKISYIPNVQKICWLEDISVSKCIKAQEKRERKVPVEVIEKQDRKLQRPMIEEGWDYVFISFPSTDGKRLVSIIEKGEQ